MLWLPPPPRFATSTPATAYQSHQPHHLATSVSLPPPPLLSKVLRKLVDDASKNLDDQVLRIILLMSLLQPLWLMVLRRRTMSLFWRWSPWRWYIWCFRRVPKEDMEDPPPVNSPRRVLSLSRKRRGVGSFVDAADDDDKASGFGVSGQHGPKPAEVYGFVGSITTIVATAVFFIWAYVPEQWLHSVGISYYPSRYWAVAMPTYFMVIIVLGLTFYIGLNFMATLPPTSLHVIFDEHSRESQIFTIPSKSSIEDDQPIEPISDIGIDQINDIMFRDLK